MHNIYRGILNERIKQYGTESILDEEALSLLTGIPIEEAIKAVSTYGVAELIKYPNVLKLTNPQMKKLKLLYQFSKRLSVATFKEKPSLDSSAVAGEYFKNQLQFYNKEVFMLGMLDNQNRLINCEQISEGTINEAAVYPRDVIKTVLNNNANSVIFAHLHPGGSLKPSKQDLEVTDKLAKALQTISVKVIDHIIVADDKFFSFAEKGLIGI